MQADSVTQTTPYGIFMGHIGVVLEPNWQAQFHRGALIYPLPTSSPRVVGLLQLRGEIIPVFDPTDAGNLCEGRTTAHNVLVVSVDRKLLGVVVKEAPKPIELRQSSNVGRPRCVFEQALFDPSLADDGSGMIWWRLDARQLFEQLSKEKSIA